MKKVLSKSLPILVTGALLTPLAAQAVPSFARQTGMSCAMCHTVFPQLTPYGRMFKLQGYTTAAGMFNEASEQSKNLSEDTSAPLAAMLQVSYAQTKNNGTNVPKDLAAMPDQFSIFYAGRISDHAGAFVQATISGGPNGNAGAMNFDNTDVRMANSTTTAGGGNLIYGLSLNNAPTVEDILNTTPVWAAAPSVGPDNVTIGTQTLPGLQLLGADMVNGNTLGVVAYGMLNSTWYGAVGAYHDTSGAGPAVKGWAPYVRLAYQQDNGTSNYDIGLISMSADVAANSMDTSQPVSKVSDLGVDGQYQVLNGVNTYTLRASYTTEKMSGNADTVFGLAKKDGKTNVLALSGTYFYDRKQGGSLGYTIVNGDSDSSYAGGKPDSSYWMAEYDYLPWLNTKFAVQYTAYNKVAGTSTNASDNNTLLLNAWFMF